MILYKSLNIKSIKSHYNEVQVFQIRSREAEISFGYVIWHWFDAVFSMSSQRDFVSHDADDVETQRKLLIRIFAWVVATNMAEGNPTCSHGHKN